jgi:hypothetical protein
MLDICPTATGALAEGHIKYCMQKQVCLNVVAFDGQQTGHQLCCNFALRTGAGTS